MGSPGEHVRARAGRHPLRPAGCRGATAGARRTLSCTLAVMLLTKLGHACVRLEKDDARLVIDPGVWAGPDALARAAAVLITHEHVDHFDDAAVRGALTADPGLELWASANVARQFGEFGGRVHTVRHGDAFAVAGFDVHV